MFPQPQTTPNNKDVAYAKKLLQNKTNKRIRGINQRAAHLYLEATSLFVNATKVKEENDQLLLEVERLKKQLTEIHVIMTLLNK